MTINDHPLLRYPVQLLMKWVNSRESSDNYVYKDAFYPVAGSRLYTARGKLDWNYDLLGVDFPTTCNIADTKEAVQIIAQMNHDKALGIDLEPHIHLFLEEPKYPNFLLAYKAYNNFDRVDTIPWTYEPFTCLTNHLYDEVEGGRQLLIFETKDLDMSHEKDVSSFLDILIYRDFNNDSGKFTGVETSSLTVTLKQFDFHVPLDAVGSFSPWSKWS